MRIIVFLLSVLFSSFALSADDITAQGFHWYTSEDEMLTEVVNPQ